MKQQYLTKEEKMKKPWPGIMKIEKIQQIRNSKIIWEEENVYNVLHSLGEQFFLTCCFKNDGEYPPANYYFGLDNRPTVAKEDKITDLVNEPSGNGYARQATSSNSGFTIEKVNNVYRASSQIFSFVANGGGWGPVSNVFMTTSNSSGVLLSSAALSSSISLVDGDLINLRMSLSLQDSSS